MKKIYTTILAAILVNGLDAQTLTQANHAPTIGDVFKTTDCGTVGINPGANGAGVTWNFSSISIGTIVTNYTCVTVASTGSTTSFPSASVAVSAGVGKNSFYSSVPSSLSYWGGDNALGGQTAVLTYSAQAIHAKYPMTLATTTTSIVGGSVAVLGQTGNFNGTVTATGVGTGTIMLPAASFGSTLKLISSLTATATVTLIGNVNINQIKYDFYAPAFKSALFSISTSTVVSLLGTTTETLVTVNSNYALGLKDNLNEVSNLNFYPNPAKGNVNVSFNNANGENASFEMINAIGQTIKKDNLGNDKGETKQNISLEGIDSGIYFIKLYVGNAVEVRKITVQ